MPFQKLEKILIIDDDKDLLIIIKLALEEIGKYSVLCCSSGVEALKEAKTFKPDLIILDVMMPTMDGLMTFEKLSNDPELKAIPVAFITASSFAEEIAHYKEISGVDVIIKPFDINAFPERLRAIWEGYCQRKVLQD
jgi:two-component system, OmpR family, response regulator